MSILESRGSAGILGFSVWHFLKPRSHRTTTIPEWCIL